MGIGDDSPQVGWCMYVHQNPNNLKLYIGITINVKQRWARKAESYRHCPKIYSAFKKYGWDYFNHIVLFDGMTKEEACKKEKDWIGAAKLAGICYNLADGGEGVSGVKYSEERKRRISEKLTGRYCSPETRAKISVSNKKCVARCKKIYAFDIHTRNLVKSYSSMQQAADAFGIKRQCITNAAKGIMPSAAGYIWSYSPYIDKANPEYDKIRDNTVYCYDLQGNYVTKYKNSTEAGKSVNGFPSTINDVCGGRRLSYKGFIWRRNITTIDQDIIKRVNKRKRV